MLKLKFGRTDQLEEMVDDISMKSPDEKLMERIMAFINDNLDDTDISNEDLADNVGISRVHLHRKMKELTGQTPHDFIRSIRLKKASQLLKRGDISITEVVYACGFGSAASFSTIFKKQFGVSPREYMMKTREE
jgi:AraC-like DNA-binding protein